MIFSADGLISSFLNLLGVTITSATGNYIAFFVASAILAISIISLLLLIFKFLVYLRKG